MQTIYKSIALLIFLLMSLSSCQKDTSKEVQAMNSFLHENYQINAEVIRYQQEKYYQKTIEKPETRNIQIDSVYKTYTALISKITQHIASKKYKVEEIQSEYNQLVNELETIVQKEEGYTINRILTTNNTAQLDEEYCLRMMQNNLVIAMSYTFEYFNKPQSIQHDVTAIKHIDTRVTQFDDRTKITLSSAIAQLVQQDRYIVVDRILLNDSETDIKPTILENEAFANIVLDSLQTGKYTIQGSVRLHETKDIIFNIPFEQKFDVD